MDMKKFFLKTAIVSVIFSPMMALAQVAEPVLTAEQISSGVPTVTIEPSLMGEVILTVPVEGSELPNATITIIAEPMVVTANPALDVVNCGDNFIYAAGTYNQFNMPVKAPICTAYNVKYASFSTVDFGATASLPVHHFDVNNDGKVIFNEAMKISELVNKVVRGETDNQYYTVQGGDDFGYLMPVNESSVESMLGDNYQDKVVYFDDAIIYSYKIVK
jgi:hypothetical protein